MSTRGTADVIFCLDASASMGTCIEGVKSHIGGFVDGLKGGGQQSWDLRLDYVAHWACPRDVGEAEPLHMESLYEPNLTSALYQSSSQERLFTSDIEEFKRGLNEVKLGYDEASLPALDSCLDFPWRPAGECHRVVVFMTDEPTSGGDQAGRQRSQLSALIQKIMELRILLFIVGPECPVYEELSEVDKSEYEVIAGLSSINFDELMSGIGKSVSVSQTSQQSAEPTVQRELYGQSSW